MNITFTNTSGVDDKIIGAPKPASFFIPQWYKDINAWITGKKEPDLDSNQTNETVKKCMPVFDAITAGYIITTPCDVWIKQIDDSPYYQWSGFNFIDFHPYIQTEGHPAVKDKLPSPKFMNPWAIKTPKGYSCLFITPTHRDLPFTILPGVVDTDTYTAPINFPFRLNDPKFEGHIPAETPMVQIIPFKRESWKHNLGTDIERQEIISILNKMKSVFFDRYKRFWWHRKEYR